MLRLALVFKPADGPQHGWDPGGGPSGWNPWLKHGRQIWDLGGMWWLSQSSWKWSYIWWSWGCCWLVGRISQKWDLQLFNLPASLCVLSVTMSCELKWNNHITNTCTKARQQLGLLYHLFGMADLAHSLISTNVSFYQPLTTVVWCGILVLHTSSLNRSLSGGLQQGWLPSATWQPS